MAVSIMCPNLRCRKILLVPNSARGGRMRCSYCGTLFLVPYAKGRDGRPYDPDKDGASRSDKKQ